MHTLEQQIKAVQKSSAITMSVGRSDLSGCLDSAAQTLAGSAANELAAERAVKRCKELEVALQWSNELLKEGKFWADKCSDVATVKYMENADSQVKENEQLLNGK